MSRKGLKRERFPFHAASYIRGAAVFISLLHEKQDRHSPGSQDWKEQTNRWKNQARAPINAKSRQVLVHQKS